MKILISNEADTYFISQNWCIITQMSLVVIYHLTAQRCKVLRAVKDPKNWPKMTVKLTFCRKSVVGHCLQALVLFIFLAKFLANDVGGATGQEENLIDNFFSFLKNIFHDILILTNFCPI